MNETVIIRRAHEADLPRIVRLSAALFREDAGQRDPWMNLEWANQEGLEYFSPLLSAEDRLVLIAERRGEVVGYLVGNYYAPHSMRPAPSAELESMFVIGEARSSGAGSALVEHFLEWCREREAVRVVVTAYRENTGAIRFYERHGFASKQITLEKVLR